MCMSKALLLVLVLPVVSGCKQGDRVVWTDDAARGRSSADERVLRRSLREAETYRHFRSSVRDPHVLVEKADAGWVTVNLYEMSQGFGHRWATLRVNTATGTAQRLTTRDDGEEEWVNDASVDVGSHQGIEETAPLQSRLRWRPRPSEPAARAVGV